MLPLGDAMEAPQDNVFIRVFLAYLIGYITEQTEFCPKDII